MTDDYCTEMWMPVVGYEGIYEVSDHGRVWAVPRVVSRLCRSGPDLVTYQYFGRFLKPSPGVHHAKYVVSRVVALKVGLSKSGKMHTANVHTLVLTAFVGPKPDAMECCHYDGDPTNNRLKNLRWDTREANSRDSVRHGKHSDASTRSWQSRTRRSSQT